MTQSQFMERGGQKRPSKEISCHRNAVIQHLHSFIGYDCSKKIFNIPPYKVRFVSSLSSFSLSSSFILPLPTSFLPLLHLHAKPPFLFCYLSTQQIHLLLIFFLEYFISYHSPFFNHTFVTFI